MTLNEAKELAMKTDYAIEAVDEEINIVDAAAFFLEGYLFKQKEEEKNDDSNSVNLMGGFYIK